jgi:hypothetical protein
VRRRFFPVVCAALCFGRVSVRAQQQQQQPPPPERPHNPTQEVAGQQPEGNAIDVGPAKLRIGGYLGLTGIYRTTNAGGGTGTRFAEIPYADTLQGNVSEMRLTAESSRLSIRVDADFPEARPRFQSLAGYFEMDFSGVAPGNLEITTTSAGLRLRHAFAEVRYRDTWFVSAGQAFSLMSPAKDQLSMWPADMELTQAVDTNYLAGLVWGRYPQLRVMWHPSRTFNWAASVENPEQIIGGGQVTLPSCCASDIQAQFNNGGSGTNDANFLPDFVSRVAFNRARLHVDAGGVLRVFRNSVAPYKDAFKTAGGGGSVDAAVRATGSTRVILQVATGSGLGRYVGGLAPDVVFHSDGSIDPLRTTSWVSGVEQRINPRTSVGGYYSGVLVDDAYEHDTGGAYIGYGFPGAANSNNRRIDEVTGTVSALTMATQNRGSAQLAMQLSWLRREPWSAGSGPSNASAFLFFAQLRYNLP